MTEQLYPKKRPERKSNKESRRYLVRYDLIYDGGSSRWIGYYNTRISARFWAFINVKILSWGGKATLKDTRPKGA